MIESFSHPISLWGLGSVILGLTIFTFYPSSRLSPNTHGCLPLFIVPWVIMAAILFLTLQQGETGAFRAVFRLSILPFLSLFYLMIWFSISGGSEPVRRNTDRFTTYRPARPAHQWKPRIPLEEPWHATTIRVAGMLLVFGGSVTTEYGRHLLARQQLPQLTTPSIEVMLKDADGLPVALAPAPTTLLRPGELACATAILTPRPAIIVRRPNEQDLFLRLNPRPENALNSQTGVAARSWICYRYAHHPQIWEVTREDWQKWQQRAKQTTATETDD